MTTQEMTRRTNIGVEHADLYKALIPVAKLADETAQAEGLSPLLIELIKLRASQINGCAFCLRIHTRDAVRKGESSDRLSVLPAWRESGYFDEQEQAALALTEYVTLIADSHRNSDLYEFAATHLSPGQISAVTWLAMVINTYNRIAISSSYSVAP